MKKIKNILCDKNALWRYLRVLISLTLLLFSVKGIALSCPSDVKWGLDEDGIHNNWILSKNDHALGFSEVHDTTRIFGRTFRTPPENILSSDKESLPPDSSLIVNVCNIEDKKGADTKKAVLFCTYVLADRRIRTYTSKNISPDEIKRIETTWGKDNVNLYSHECTYSCPTTVRSPDKCSVDFS